VFLGSSPQAGDYFVFTVFLTGAQMQMLFSTIYHTFFVHSPECCKWVARLDYAGISMMIVGSYYPPMYYSFLCHPRLQILYMTSISLLGAIALLVSFLPVFHTHAFRQARTAFFLLFGFFAVFPLPHMALVLPHTDFIWSFLGKEALMGFLYVMGAVVYLTRVPERWHPGKFDISPCSSHTLWHLFTIAAACVQLWACLFCFQHKDLLSQCDHVIQ